MSRNAFVRNAMLSIAVTLALSTGTAWAQQQDAARATQYAGAAFDAKSAAADPAAEVDPASKSISSKGVTSTKPDANAQTAEPAPQSVSEPGVVASKPRHDQAIEIQPASKSIREKGVNSTKSRRNE